MASVIGYCPAGNIELADKSEYHILWLCAEENVIEPGLAVVGDSVLVFVSHIDNGHTVFKGTVIVVGADIGVIIMGIAASVEGKSSYCALLLTFIAFESGNIDSVSTDELRVD